MTKLNRGYDFVARSGDEEWHVEIKGARGPHPSFPITDNEVTLAKEDAQWAVFVVTGALTKRPRVQEWTAEEFLCEFQLRPITTYMAKLRS